MPYFGTELWGAARLKRTNPTRIMVLITLSRQKERSETAMATKRTYDCYQITRLDQLPPIKFKILNAWRIESALQVTM